MATLIKKRIVKYLSKFAKNTSADKINLSAFKGEGELTNLELDEDVLTELLELPTWTRLSKATCNRVTIRIPWLKIDSVPIELCLDEVQVEVVTCEELRTTGDPLSHFSLSGGGRYGFSEKVVDGMTVRVNSVRIRFISPAFEASVELSRIRLESCTPHWKREALKHTRLKSVRRGEVLIFKELHWQTMRLEACSTHNKQLSPIRLLTNNSWCRLIIKKRLEDCAILGCRLVVVMDDLLWVFTDSQLTAAFHFVGSLAGLIKKATEMSQKVKAVRKLAVVMPHPGRAAPQHHGKGNDKETAFQQFDVIETSYHFSFDKIDLHLCDDLVENRSSHPQLESNGAACQISLCKLRMDYYPYHLCTRGRNHWLQYKEDVHVRWLQQAFNTFKAGLLDLVQGPKTQHMPLNRAPPHVDANDTRQAATDVPTASRPPVLSNGMSDGRRLPDGHAPAAASNPVQVAVLNKLSNLMCTCLIIRLGSFNWYKVTTPKQKEMPEPFISGWRRKRAKAKDDKDRSPSMDVPAVIHAEFIWYYYPGDDNFPVPSPKLYVVAKPIQVVVDTCTVLWLNAFAMGLQKSLSSGTTGDFDSYMDVKLEAIWPRLIFENRHNYPSQKDRPRSLHIQTSRLMMTNCRTLEEGSRADLAKCIEAFQTGGLFFGSGFPSVENDCYVVTDKFLKHAAAEDNRHSLPKTNISFARELSSVLRRDSLWIDSRDVWFAHLDPVWGDFFGISATRNRPVAFLDHFPLVLWAHLAPTPSGSFDVHVLAHVASLVSVQLNHYQYLFLMRMLEAMTELSSFLTKDTLRIGNNATSTVCVGAVVPQVDVSLVLAAQMPGKESPGVDLDSIVPDSSEMTDFDVDVRGRVSSLAGLQDSLSEHSLHQQRNSTFRHQGSLEKSTSELAIAQQQLEDTPPSTTPSLPDITPPPFIDTKIFAESWSTFRRGVTNVVAKGMGDPSNVVSDAQSIASNDSSGDEFVLVDAGTHGTADVFHVVEKQPCVFVEPIEMACEAMEESPSEISVQSAFRRQDMISVVTFRLGTVELVKQSRGYVSSLKLQCFHLSYDECTSISWDEFQEKFSIRGHGWTEELSASPLPKIQLRQDQQLHGNALRPSGNECVDLVANPLSPLRDVVLQANECFLHIRAKDVNLKLNMSTVQALMDLVKDELMPVALPMMVELTKIALHLEEDRPSPDITSPGAIPLDVLVPSLTVTRDNSGIFQLESGGPSLGPNGDSSADDGDNTESNRNYLNLLNLQRENGELRKRLTCMDELRRENQALRQRLQELEQVHTFLREDQQRDEPFG